VLVLFHIGDGHFRESREGFKESLRERGRGSERSNRFGTATLQGHGFTGSTPGRKIVVTGENVLKS